MNAVGDGSIYPYGKGFRGVLQVPGPFGITKPKYFKSTKSKAAVRRAMDKFRREFEAAHGQTMTVAGCSEAYIERCKAKGRREKTVSGYEAYHRRFIKPILGHILVHNLTAEQVEAMLEQVPGDGSQKVLVRGYLRAALKAIGMKQRVVATNAAALADPPKVTRGTPHMPSREAAEKAIGKLPCLVTQALFTTILETGLRPHKEAAQLTWNEIILRNDGPWFKVREAKTRAGQVPRPINKKAWAAIEAYPKTSMYVFPNSEGKPFDESKLRKLWTKACKDAKVQRCTIYQLRHLFGSEKWRKGVRGKNLSTLMGHTDVRTSAIYIHAFDEDLRSWVDD